MRILRLDADGWSVDLHPYVTVVSGLTDDQRAEIAAAFQAAIRGRTTSLRGLIEVHGVVLDLDEPSLALLDLDDVAVDAVVEPTDLPGAASAGLERQLRAAERRLESLEVPYRERSRATDAARVALEEAREAADEAHAAVAEAEAADDGAHLARLEAVLAAAEAALEQLAGPGSRAAGELEQAERALAELRDDGLDHRLDELAATRRALEDRRRELHPSLDADAADAFEAALAELRQLEEAAADARYGEPDPPAAVPSTGAVAGEPAAVGGPNPDLAAARRDELRAILALHASFDPSELRGALDAIRSTPDVGELVPSPEALSLADRIEAAERRLAELDAGMVDAPAPGEVERAGAALDEIRSSLDELERASEPANLDADIKELERAHSAAVEARERLHSRFGKARAHARYDEAAAAEEAILQRLGLRSYTEYVTGGRAALHGGVEPAELRRLRDREREAEAGLRALERRAQQALDVAAAGQDLRELRARARALLGDAGIEDHELTRGLLTLRVPAERSSPLDELLAALEGVGLPVRSLDLTRDDAEAMAADWLDEYYRAEDRRAALEHELAALESGAGAAVVEPPVAIGAEELVPDAGRLTAEELDEHLAAAQAAVRDAKDRMIAHETAMREIDDIDVELEAVEGEQRQHELRELQVAEARRRVEQARAATVELDEQRRSAEARVVEARAALEQHRAAPPAVAGAAAALEAADAAVARAELELHEAVAALEAARAGYDAAVEDVAAIRQALSDVADEPPPVEEIEWYLLARLAAQRQVSFAGSVPIVVDRALDSVDDAGLVRLLERLERMAGAVQVVHLTDDDRIIAWATGSGEDRVAVSRVGVPSDVH